MTNIWLKGRCIVLTSRALLKFEIMSSLFYLYLIIVLQGLYLHLSTSPLLIAKTTVCLSILGTWRGEANEQWSSAQSTYTVLRSIQSLLHSEPYVNEPGVWLRVRTCTSLCAHVDVFVACVCVRACVVYTCACTCMSLRSRTSFTLE